MPDDCKVSFTTEKSIRYRPEFDVAQCEKVCLADVDGDGSLEVIILRFNSIKDRFVGELSVYDLELNLKASDRWDGTAMDVAVADIDGDGAVEIIVAGGIKSSAPMIRAYRCDENYKGNLQLSLQLSWEAPEGLFSTAKAVHIVDADGRVEIAVLSVVEGSGDNTGYVQLRLYGADARLKKSTRWTPMGGRIVRWGHCMTAADIDSDGRDELITLINFRHEGKQKAELRAFDHDLILKRRCETLTDDAMFATCMSVGDVDNDGEAEVVVAGAAFPKPWQGATNRLMVFGGDLELKTRTTWKTFRHSWVWDLQIADIDSDGNQEIITYGGTSMRGRNQENANIMGEIRVWDGGGLTTKDMFIWQSKPGEDTRPSRGFALRDGNHTRFVVATSRWSRRQRTQELDIRTLKYEPTAGAMGRYSDFIKAYDERSVEILETLVAPEDGAFTPIALEALAICGGDRAAKAIGKVLIPSDRPLFLRAVGLLRNMSTGAIDELRGIGFALPDDWAIISPFDNASNNGFEAQYPPEIGIDLNAFYAGKDKVVRWGKIDDHRQDVYINLAYTHFESFERTGIEFWWNVLRTESVAYALTYIYSPANMEAQLSVGSADGVKLWLGDELKCSADAVREAAPAQETIPVSLMEGKNRVLLKVANHRTEGWGFYFRVTDTEGRPIPDLRYERPEVSHAHNQMLTCGQLLSLMEAEDEHLRCLAASQWPYAREVAQNL